MTDSAKVALVRSIYAALERGDFALAEWAHPQIEYVVADGPEPGSWVGKAEMAQAARAAVDQDEHALIIELAILVGHNAVTLPDAQPLARGKTSRLELAQIGSKGAQLFHVLGGKVTRYVTWHDRDRALADLGLTLEDDRP